MVLAADFPLDPAADSQSARVEDGLLVPAAGKLWIVTRAEALIQGRCVLIPKRSALVVPAIRGYDAVTSVRW